MKTNGKRIGGRTYPDYDKQDMDILAAARRWLNRHGMHEQSAFTPEEADRRVAFYAAQVASEGHITRWLGLVQPKPRTRYRSRFAFGDALGRFGQVSAG